MEEEQEVLHKQLSLFDISCHHSLLGPPLLVALLPFIFHHLPLQGGGHSKDRRPAWSYSVLVSALMILALSSLTFRGVKATKSKACVQPDFDLFACVCVCLRALCTPIQYRSHGALCIPWGFMCLWQKMCINHSYKIWKCVINWYSVTPWQWSNTVAAEVEARDRTNCPLNREWTHWILKQCLCSTSFCFSILLFDASHLVASSFAFAVPSFLHCNVEVTNRTPIFPPKRFCPLRWYSMSCQKPKPCLTAHSWPMGRHMTCQVNMENKTK